MAAEEYIERIIIRQDTRPEVGTPSFTDEQVDEAFEFEGMLTLKHIIKAIRNKTHNSHDYVFVIDSITKLQQES